MLNKFTHKPQNRIGRFWGANKLFFAKSLYLIIAEKIGQKPEKSQHWRDQRHKVEARRGNELVEPLKQSNSLGIVDVGEGILDSELPCAHEPLGAAVDDKEIRDHTAGNGQNILLLGLETPCSHHPQGQSDCEDVVEPEIEEIRGVPGVVCKARGDAEHNCCGGEH